MNDPAIAALDARFPTKVRTKPVMAPIEKLEQAGERLAETARLLATISKSFVTLSRAAFELANTWRTQDES